MNKVKTFGQNLKNLRLRVHLTQDELASLLKISHQSISKWENDLAIPSIIYCVPLIDFLKCTLEELFQVFINL